MADTDENNSKEKETEIAIFAKIGDVSALESADNVEHQIQVESSLGKNAFCRVRKSSVGNKISYVYTFKVNSKKSEETATTARTEYSVDVDEAFFEGFQLVADHKQIKTRYVFKSQKITIDIPNGEEIKSIDVPDVVYQVDVFKTEDGKLCEYCKIDVELDSILLFLEQNYPEIKDLKLNIKINHLPFKPFESFLNDGTEKSSDLVKHLYKTYFNIELDK